MKRYKMTAYYRPYAGWDPDIDERQWIERTAFAEGKSPEHAAVTALLRGGIPAEFIEGGPIFWHPNLAGQGERWPVVVDSDNLAWGDEDDARTLTFEAEEVPATK